MQASLVAAISFSLSQVLLSALLLGQQRPWQVRECLFAILLLAVTAYLMIPLTRGGAWNWLPGSLQTLVPGMFWLFSASIFEDHFRLRTWQVLLVLATVLPPMLGRLLGLFVEIGLDWILFTLPQILEFVLLGLTVWVVSRYWKVDLVESRRRLRLWFVCLNGACIFALIFSSVVLFASERWYSSWQYLPVGVILLAMNALLLRYKREVFFAVTAREQPEDVPRTGTREEPAPDRALVPPLQALTIAMDAGFRSLSSFNKAFKEKMGVTPTDYRKSIKKRPIGPEITAVT